MPSRNSVDTVCDLWNKYIFLTMFCNFLSSSDWMLWSFCDYLFISTHTKLLSFINWYFEIVTLEFQWLFNRLKHFELSYINDIFFSENENITPVLFNECPLSLCVHLFFTICLEFVWLTHQHCYCWVENTPHCISYHSSIFSFPSTALQHWSQYVFFWFY